MKFTNDYFKKHLLLVITYFVFGIILGQSLCERNFFQDIDIYYNSAKDITYYIPKSPFYPLLIGFIFSFLLLPLSHLFFFIIKEILKGVFEALYKKIEQLFSVVKDFLAKIPNRDYFWAIVAILIALILKHKGN